MEFIKRVWAEKFTLTDESKADIKAGKRVEYQGEPVKHNGADRFHVLLTINGSHATLNEGHWLVKDSPNTEILWDDQFKARYSLAGDQPAATRPIRSEALEAFLKKHQPAPDAEVANKQTPAPVENSTPETPEAVAELPSALPEETAAPVETEFSPSLNGQQHE